MERVYLDYAATSFVRDEVFLRMRPYFSECFGNASGIYESGRRAANALEDSRKEIARLLSAKNPKEIYFTSGGTESNNWAIKGVMRAGGKKHMVTTVAEHHSVLQCCEALIKEGYKVTYLPTDANGLVSAGQVREAIHAETALVSVMAVNNEVGTINPIDEIAAVTSAAGVLLHTDAVAAAGHRGLAAMRADLLSFSAHKFYGPKGIGGLYARDGVKLLPLIDGGAQERGRRAGTENIAGAVGMAEALRLAQDEMEHENARLKDLRDALARGIRERIPGAVINAGKAVRVESYLNVLFPGTEARALLVALDHMGVECSAGSACQTGSVHPSHVLLAMGLSREDAAASLRFTLGRATTEEQIAYTVDCLEKVCAGNR